MNYATLSALIQEYCESTETSFVANIPDFVKLAENRIYNSVQIPAIKRNQTGTLTPNNKYLRMPADWLATFSLAVIAPVTGAQTYLLDKDANFIRECYPNPNITGVPKYYAVFDKQTFILGPTPDSNYQVEMHYFYYPESIVTAGTTWLGDKFETLLLYGALREAYTYLKGEQDLIQNYESKYQEALAQLTRLGDGLNRRDAYRDGQPRVQVQS